MKTNKKIQKRKLSHHEYEEHLAKERTSLSKRRTILSNERTLLSHIRTAFTIFLFGVAVIKFFEFNQLAVYVGIASIIFGVAILIFGLTSSFNRNRRIRNYH